jgi:hypothetical protein
VTPRFEPERIFAVLAAHRVGHVVIGGVAAIAHGSRRATFDVDVVPSPAPENSERLAKALSELGAEGVVIDGDFKELDLADEFDLARGVNFSVATTGGRLDLMTRAKGAPPYEDLEAASVEAHVGGVTIRVAGLDHLIAMKRAAGRPRDLQDIADLTGPSGEDATGEA